ncbi:MAG: sigma 54-interacting transcriptional regulator, partial [Treponema sp.]|nr:sigma 54-interacting transcriptional regulator [Treponema sp.]
MKNSEYDFLLGSGLFSGQKGSFVKLYQILESFFDGIYITDGSANTIFINRSYEAITGLNRASMLGKNMQELQDARMIDQSGSLLALKTRTSATLEQKFSTGKHALITSTPFFDEQGNIEMVITNVRDVTELYRLKKQLTKNEEVTRKQRMELEHLQKTFVVPGNEFITNDAVMLRNLFQANKVAKQDTIVLLLGETGVGKEVFANYVYRNSARANERFIKINCGSIAVNLAESELFGYESGSFTGANSGGKPGLFEVANKGTIFLDEIGELSLDMQVKLLRVIQEKEILRVGSTKPRKIDVRIIAATNRDLDDMAAKKQFRSDLLYRINVFPIVVPPLRERPNDILPLSRFILEEFGKSRGFRKEFSSDAELALMNYHWPGNIRELRNVIERAVILSNDNEIFPDDLAITKPALWHLHETASPMKPVVLKELLENIESIYIHKVYEKYRNIRRAASHLSMDPATYLRKLKKYTNLKP